jgi:hypothetical protein
VEHRDLSLEEWNFRDIVSRHLQSLLSRRKLIGSNEEQLNGSNLVINVLSSSMPMLPLSTAETPSLLLKMCPGRILQTMKKKPSISGLLLGKDLEFLNYRN